MDAAMCPLCEGAAAECAKLTVTPSHIELHCAQRNDSVRVSMEKFNRLALLTRRIPPFEMLIHHVRMELRDGQATPDLGSDT